MCISLSSLNPQCSVITYNIILRIDIIRHFHHASNLAHHNSLWKFVIYYHIILFCKWSLYHAHFTQLNWYTLYGVCSTCCVWQLRWFNSLLIVMKLVVQENFVLSANLLERLNLAGCWDMASWIWYLKFVLKLWASDVYNIFSFNFLYLKKQPPGSDLWFILDFIILQLKAIWNNNK